MKKKAKTTKRKRSARSGITAYPVSTTIVIQAGNVILDPAPIGTYPGGPVIWVVNNRDTELHVVSIDFGKFKHKNNGNKKEHPFPKSRIASVVALPNTPATMSETVKGKFPKKLEQYKYTIESTSADGTTTRSLDPDLDVVDPNPIHRKA